MSRLGETLDKERFDQLKALMVDGKKLSSWSSRKRPSRRAPAPSNLETVDEHADEDIQYAVEASEDMQLAMRELGLTDELLIVIGVSNIF